MTVARSNIRRGEEMVKCHFLGASSSDTILGGQVLVANTGASSDYDKEFQLRQCSLSYHKGPFWIASPGIKGSIGDDEEFDAIPITAVPRIVKVRVDQTVAFGDYIGIHAETYNWRKGRFLGPLCGRVLEAKTVSSGTELVTAEVSLSLPVSIIDRARYVAEVSDDFFGFGDDTGGWDSVSFNNAGTYVVGDSAVGELVISTGANSNDGAVISTNKTFNADNPFYLKGRLKVTEAATNELSMVFGLHDLAKTAEPLSATGTLVGSADQAYFFKVEGGTVWQATSDSAAGSADTDTNCGTRDGNYHVFEIYRPTNGDNGPVYFYIDGVLVHAAVGTACAPSGSNLVVVVAVHSAGSAEAVTVDYIEVQNPLY